MFGPGNEAKHISTSLSRPTNQRISPISQPTQGHLILTFLQQSSTPHNQLILSLASSLLWSDKWPTHLATKVCSCSLCIRENCSNYWANLDELWTKMIAVTLPFFSYLFRGSSGSKLKVDCIVISKVWTTQWNVSGCRRPA